MSSDSESDSESADDSEQDSSSEEDEETRKAREKEDRRQARCCLLPQLNRALTVGWLDLSEKSARRQRQRQQQQQRMQRQQPKLSERGYEKQREMQRRRRKRRNSMKMRLHHRWVELSYQSFLSSSRVSTCAECVHMCHLTAHDMALSSNS